MFFVPGILISIATFPGVIVHEFAHQLFCRLTRVAVFKVVYFQFQNPVGYVLHEVTNEKWKSVLISVGPFFVNTIVGAVISMPAAIPVFKFHETNPFYYLLIWLGVSIAMHAFPSTGDAQSMWSSVSEGKSFTKYLVMPIVGLIYLGAFGSMFWLDLIYGAGVAVGFPNLIVNLLA
jgi:hypothetical protein